MLHINTTVNSRYSNRGILINASPVLPDTSPSMRGQAILSTMRIRGRFSPHVGSLSVRLHRSAPKNIPPRSTQADIRPCLPNVSFRARLSGQLSDQSGRIASLRCAAIFGRLSKA